MTKKIKSKEIVLWLKEEQNKLQKKFKKMITKQSENIYDFRGIWIDVTKRMNELQYRMLLLKTKIPIVCKMCGAKENIRGFQMSVHHIDGDHDNNLIENLVWICESCHQYLHNPKGINSEMVIIDGYKKESRK